jgi:NAD(P)-dependent dehydrogenase (short-subunit alcohol dehydrogenase family)
VDLGLRGRTAIVTGASRGIGAATATELAREGVDVALLARSNDPLTALAAELERTYRIRAFSIAVDLSSAVDVNDAMARADTSLGRVDILVNNAGASPQASFDEATDEMWSEAFELKLLGYVRAIRAVLPGMRAAGRGRIVNVVGMAGRFATPGYVLGAFNAALLHLTKAIAQDLAPGGVGVVAINPTYVETDRMLRQMQKRADIAGRDVESFRRNLLATVPSRRFATPDEIGRLIVILASDVSSYVLGSALQADGANSTGVV